jgi:hypothetical protein
MAIQSSFPTVAEQILSFNKNIVEVLSKLNSITTTSEPSVDIQIMNEQGVLGNFTLPSFTYLKSEIERLNNNINSLYSIDDDGALIQTSSQNKFRKIITVDLNREPNPVDNLGVITSFRSTKNWFFDNMLNPMLWVEINLDGKIENNVRKCLSRRYIVDFAKDQGGNFTPLGQSALNSFNTLFRNTSNINVEEFENWHRTTPGIIEPLNPHFDEEVFDLEPNQILYDGVFSVLAIEEDRLNRKLWYSFDTLDYLVTDINEIRQLSIGSELIINADKTSTKYRVIEISTAESKSRVRLERIEGREPIPVGIGTLKIYSPVIYTKRLRISVGYDERNVVFIKPLNADNNILAKKWSLGTGFWSNDLRLVSENSDNGLTMEQFYIDYVYDYGEVLQDLVAKKVPNKLAGIPTPPTLNSDNFKVVQINKHLTDTPDANLLKQKHNYQLSVQSEIKQINEAILERNKRSRSVRFVSPSEKKQFDLEITDLVKKKDSKSKLLSSTTKEILDLSKSPITKVEPKFRIRGFWNMPEAVITRGTLPQEVVQFIVEYRYLSKDGRETPIETFSIPRNIGSSKQMASFSNWNVYKTDVRKRVYNPQTGEYNWQIEDVESADTPNINQLDIAIQVNEKVEIRIKSISEVGWPESPVESEWSDVLTVEFPDDLNNVLNENEFILREATKEDLIVRMENQLSAKGLDDHLTDTTTINGKIYHHDATKILSGMRDDNGAALDMFEYLKKLEDRIKSLEEKIKRAKGELEIVIYRHNQEFVVSNGSETTFNIECEDYLDSFTGTNIPTGRVYANNIYVVKDFVVKFRNKAVESPLGLLSNRNYLQNPSAYSSNTPQVFWVNNQDELLYSDVSGQTRSQLNNQFIWSVNYDSVTQDTVAKLSENVGNLFVPENNNSITNILGSTEYSLGFNENSILSFVGNNRTLLDPTKWIDKSLSVASTTKLLTTIHPIVSDLESVVENNVDKVRTIGGGDANSVVIPINIYFKMNALDTNQAGLNYRYINLNNSRKTVQHVKKIKFMVENEAENRPFIFSIKFNINRNKVIVKKTAQVLNALTR